MKKFVIAVLACAFLLGFGMKVFAAGSDRMPASSGEGTEKVRPGVEPPEAPRYTCPSTPYVNCMPPVEKSARSRCSPEYLRWAKEHCPGFKVVY